MVDQGPVVSSRAGSQGPKLQGELLGAPRLLPQMEEALTTSSLDLKMVQCRISLSPHSVGPLQGFPGEARDKSGHPVTAQWSRVDGGQV